jgi:preprotein translocase subunit SecF
MSLKWLQNQAFPVNPEKYFGKMYENFDRYAVIPLLLVVLSVGFLGFQYATTADFPYMHLNQTDNGTKLVVEEGKVLEKGVVFQGGTQIRYSINESFDTAQIEQIFAEQGRPGTQARKEISGNQTSLLVTVPPPEIGGEEEAEEILNDNSIKNFRVDAISFNSVTASVSQYFLQQAVIAFGLAFTIMSIVIFTAFRDIIPAMAVILAATADIVFAVSAMSFFGIPLTLGTLAALLMLIGYSVDTDIVLSSRVLKRERKSLKQRIWGATKTGLTMSSGGIAGFTILYLVSIAIVGPSELSNIAAVMVIGLLADMPFTWFGNAYILKRYSEGDIDALYNRTIGELSWM